MDMKVILQDLALNKSLDVKDQTHDQDEIPDTAKWSKYVRRQNIFQFTGLSGL